MPAAPSDAVRGILLMSVAGAMFACLDATAKVLGRTMEAVDIVWLRYVTQVLLLLVLLRVWRDPSPFHMRRPLMQLARGLCLLGSTFFNFWALQYLQLAQTAAIMFGAPLLVTALAGPLLGESVGVRRWAAVLIGFAGVLIVLRPGTGTMHWAAVLSLCAMVNYGLYAVLTRRLHATETSVSLLMISAIVGTVALAPVAPGAIDDLHGVAWALALLMGAVGGIGHFALVRAHRIASASVLAPFIYTQMIWMIALGYLLFGDVPDGWTLVGAGVIVTAGLYILHRERVRGHPVAAPDPAAQ